MTAISDMVKMAASLSVAGSPGALNVTIVDVQAPVQALFESVRPYPSHPGNLGLPGAGHAPKETTTEPSYPVDIFSIIAEIQRSIGQLRERTASVPEVYAYYTPAGIRMPDLAYPPPVTRPETADPGVAQRELAAPQEKSAGEEPRRRKEPAATHDEERSPGIERLDREVWQSGVAIEGLKGDLVSLTRYLAGVEAAMDEIVRLSLAGNVDVDVMPVPPAEAPYATPVTSRPLGKEGSPVEQPVAGIAKPSREPAPPEFVRSLALSASLPGALWASTLEATSLPEAVSRKIINSTVAAAPEAVSMPAVDGYLKQASAMPVAPGINQAPAAPSSPVATAAAPVSPVVQTIETYNTIVNVVKASEVVSSILPTRSATKAEITQYLLAMPGQPADDRQIKALVDLAAMLQANVRPAVLAAAPKDPFAGPGMPGDIRELWTAVRGLQDAYEALRGNVPGPADVAGLQKVTGASAILASEATAPRLDIAIEGVKTPGGSIELPDLTPVAAQFRQMQTMMARLQVPMYGEGGAVTEPTLALVAETGPEVIVPSLDFTAQIASLNNNYASLWTDVIVLRDGVREIVAGVNDALSSVGGGGDEGPLSMDKGYDQMGLDFFQQIADKWLTGHGSASLSELEELFKSSTAAGFFKGATGMAMSGLVGVYGMNALEEKLFDEGKKEEKSGAGGGEGGEGDAEDKEEEEFWDLMDKIDTINTIRNKRQGKFE